MFQPSRSTLARIKAALFCSLAVVLVTLCAPGRAQVIAPPPLPPEPAFPKLFPKYSGVNGYEDLVIAGDLLLGNEAFKAAQEPNATLKIMRKALEDTNVDRALQSFHSGLEKPIQSPRDPNKLDENTLLPEYSEFRNVARLLAIQEHVALADGQVSKAIDTMRDGLRFGYVVQSDTLLGGLVGIAIDAIILQKFALHFDQMALRDCIHVTAVAQEWLKQPSRAEVVLSLEHRSLQNMLDGWKNDPERFRTMVKLQQPKDPPASDADLAAIELSEYVNSGAAAIPAMLEQVRAMAETGDRALILEMRKPVWQRKPVRKIETRATMAARLYGMVTPSYSQALGRFDTEIAQIHLLGVHGAIRRFRWENNRLPSSLTELNLPLLTTDPFTGGLLSYKMAGDSYELSSAGPSDSGDSGAATGPVYLPRKPN